MHSRIYVYICIYAYVYVCIFVYIYVCRSRLFHHQHHQRRYCLSCDSGILGGIFWRRQWRRCLLPCVYCVVCDVSVLRCVDMCMFTITPVWCCLFELHASLPIAFISHIWDSHFMMCVCVYVYVSVCLRLVVFVMLCICMHCRFAAAVYPFVHWYFFSFLV